MSVKAIEAEVYIQSGVEAEVQIGREIVKTVYEAPVLESLEVVANGTYEPEEGVDGYSDVTVNVPGKIPVLEQLRAIANGEYYPAEGVDGFDEVLVDVPSNLKDAYVCEGTFTATQDGIFELDTSYEGEGDPHIMIIWADKNIRSDEFLEKAPPYALNVYSALKRTASKPSYAETNYLNGQCYTNYSYENNSNEYNISYGNTTLILSRSEPNYGGGKALRFYDNRTMRLFMASEPSEETPTAPYFATGITYRYYVVYDEPQPITPEETNVIEGEFEATETGVLTIDLPYEGDGFPKSIVITPAEGVQTSDFLQKEKVTSNYRYVVNNYAAFKVNEKQPVYDEEVIDSAVHVRISFINSSDVYANTYNTRYIYKTTDPVKGTYILIVPDNRHIKVFCATKRDGTTQYFWTNVKYRYCVYY